MLIVSKNRYVLSVQVPLNPALNKLAKESKYRAHSGKVRTSIAFYLYAVPTSMESCLGDIFTNVRCTRRGLTLTYDSLRANPKEILHFGYSSLAPDDDTRLVAGLTLSRGAFTYQIPGWSGGMGLDGGEHFWRLPDERGLVEAALSADLHSLPSGRYDYHLTTGMLRLNNRTLAKVNNH